MIKKSDIVRWTLTIVLLVCIWLGQQWAIKLSITLSLIGGEMWAMLYRLNKKGRI